MNKDGIKEVEEYLKREFSEYELEASMEDFKSGNHFFRLHKKGHGIRFEVTKVVVEDQTPNDVMEVIERIRRRINYEQDYAARVRSDGWKEVSYN